MEGMQGAVVWEFLCAKEEFNIHLSLFCLMEKSGITEAITHRREGVIIVINACVAQDIKISVIY